MKRLTRMLLFASVALYLTTLWNKGFVVSANWTEFLIVALLLGLTVYIVVPLSKIALFPIHILTFGLLSIICYMGMLYLVDNYSNLVVIKSWTFPGINLGGISIQKVVFSEFGNLFASAVSVSVITSSLEKIT